MKAAKNFVIKAKITDKIDGAYTVQPKSLVEMSVYLYLYLNLLIHIYICIHIFLCMKNRNAKVGPDSSIILETFIQMYYIKLWYMRSNVYITSENIYRIVLCFSCYTRFAQCMIVCMQHHNCYLHNTHAIHIHSHINICNLQLMNCLYTGTHTYTHTHVHTDLNGIGGVL